MLYKIIEHYTEFVVVLKPAGMLSVPARDVNDERKVLGRLLEADLQQQIFPVHRLDFEVAGLMIYALNAVMHRTLSMAFEQHHVFKTYIALAEKFSSNLDKQEWKSLLLKGKKRTYEAPYGKTSITYAQTLENFFINNQSISKWQLNPHTGRSHQLRYEMMKHGHAILGDQLYGSRYKLNTHQIALISAQIILPTNIFQNSNTLPTTFKLSDELVSQLLPSKLTLDI